MIQKQKCFQSCSRGNYGGFFLYVAFIYFSLSCFASLASEGLCRALSVFVAVTCQSRCEQKVLLSKHSAGLSLHVVLAYFFDPGILISCCPMSNLAVWQPFSALHSLFALHFFLNGGLSTYTILFLW